MKARFWIFVINWIERNYVGSDKPYTDQILDGCLAIRDGLIDGKMRDQK